MMRSGLRRSLHVGVRLQNEPISVVFIEDPNCRLRDSLLLLISGRNGDAYTSIMPNRLSSVRISIGENLIRSNPDLPTAIPNTSVIILHYNLSRMLSIVIEAFGQ